MTTSIEHFTHQTEIERQKRKKTITSKKAVLGRLKLEIIFFFLVDFFVC